MDMRSADPQEVTELVSRAKGLVIGMPPASGSGAQETQATLGTILAAVHGKQTVGLFESYGGDDEPVDPLANKFQDLSLIQAFAPIRIKDTPTEGLYQFCEEAGTDLGQWVNRDRTLKHWQFS